jgi:tRNA-guanine family transglycosylase
MIHIHTILKLLSRNDEYLLMILLSKYLFRGKEILAATLATIHNERFIVRLVDQMRASIADGSFSELKAQFLSRYTYKNPSPS